MRHKPSIHQKFTKFIKFSSLSFETREFSEQDARFPKPPIEFHTIFKREERERERLQTPLWLFGNEGEVEQHHARVDGQRDLFPIRDDILACHSSLNSSKKPCERQGRSGNQHRPPAYHTLGLHNFPVVVLLQRGHDHGIPGIRGCRGGSLHPEGLHYAEAGEGGDGAGVRGRGSGGLNCVS